MSHTPCFALLDDASAPDTGARSRLYTAHAGTLQCDDAAGWPQLLDELQQALARGLYAVPLLTYELGGQLAGVPTAPTDAPLAQVLLFRQCQHLSAAEVAAWLAAQSDAAPAGVARIHANIGQQEFTAAINRIRDYIAAGDTYQVNYTYRLRFDAFGSVVSLYARLRQRQPVPYGALIALPDGSAVLSLSPELFMRHQRGELMARPMKGTAPAATDDAENNRRAAALASDPKNRAENLMIVDLLRNDLGRVAVTGSVEVPALFDVQRYSSVLQMTSTVRCQVRPDATLGQIFAALYPCGSITGAPKRRTMEIINELEPDARGIYTGAIGWFDPPQGAASLGDFCLSVPIRTLALQAPDNGMRRGQLGVGAGIVFDSQANDEYAECQLKARFLTELPNHFELFETMRADRSGCSLLERHLDRLQASAKYFGFRFERAAASGAVASACAGLAPGPHRMRLALLQDGTLNIVAAALAPLAEPVGLLIAADATQADQLFLRHKSSIRARYDAGWREAEAQGGFDMLFFNEQGELAEGGRSNVFIELNGQWLTPPLESGVLPGVMRSVLLADPAWKAQQRVITREMLAAASEVMVCNALRGPLKAVVWRR